MVIEKQICKEFLLRKCKLYEIQIYSKQTPFENILNNIIQSVFLIELLLVTATERI